MGAQQNKTKHGRRVTLESLRQFLIDDHALLAEHAEEISAGWQELMERSVPVIQARTRAGNVTQNDVLQALFGDGKRVSTAYNTDTDSNIRYDKRTVKKTLNNTKNDGIIAIAAVILEKTPEIIRDAVYIGS